MCFRNGPQFYSHKYNKPSLNLPITGPILNGPIREVAGLGILDILTMDGLGPKIKRSIQGSGGSVELIG